MAEKLTPQQEALFSKYLEKWRKVALSTEPINRNKAEEAIKTAYTLIDEPQPQVFFFDSPYAAVVALDKLCHEIGYLQLKYDNMFPRLKDKLKDYLIAPSDDKYDRQIELQADELHEIIIDDLQECDEQSNEYLIIPDEFEPGSLQPDTICRYMPWYDFCVSELNYNYNSQIWQTFQEIVNNCGWIASYQELCVVCYRPCLLTFDEQNKLHGEDQPAIQFVDGYSVYACHGERLSKFE